MYVVGLMEECITWVDSVTLQVCGFIYVSMEFLDNSLSLLLHDIDSPFYLRILQKTILYSDF